MLTGLQVYKLVALASWKFFGFWNAVSLIADGLLIAAFVLRIAGIATMGEHGATFRLRSFQCLSFAAPLLW